MLNVFLKNFLFLALVFLTMACGKDFKRHENSSSLGFTKSLTILGENDLIRVPENPDLYSDLLSSKILNAIGRMELGCTVTHIGGGYAILQVIVFQILIYQVSTVSF